MGKGRDDCYFEYLQASRKKPKAGDVFAYKIKGQPFGFGRVMRDDAAMLPATGLLVVHIYKAFSADMATIPKLDNRRLLVKPIIIDETGWRCGFLVTVGHIPLSPREKDRRYCFYDGTWDRYYDEYNNVLKQPRRPCADWGWAGYGYLADHIASALGLPPLQPSAPEVDEFERQMQKLAKKASRLDIDKCSTPELRRCLKQLLDDLEKIGRKHDELFDTDVREKLYEAVFRAFVMQEDGYEIPDELCMFSSAGNKAVHRALERFVMAARTEVERAGKRLNTPAKRLCAFEDLTIESRDGEGFDTFFGALIE